MNLHKHGIKCKEKPQGGKHEPENIQLPTHYMHTYHIERHMQILGIILNLVHVAGTSSWYGYYPKI